jgi:hypothetical protein
MPQEVQRRKREGHGAYVERSKEASRASRETKRQKAEAAHAPWRKAWEKETGKKYGIATAGEYNTWLEKKRKERAAAQAPSSVSAQDAGDAMAKDKKKKEE